MNYYFSYLLIGIINYLAPFKLRKAYKKLFIDNILPFIIYNDNKLSILITF